MTFDFTDIVQQYSAEKALSIENPSTGECVRHLTLSSLYLHSEMGVG